MAPANERTMHDHLSVGLAWQGKRAKAGRYETILVTSPSPVPGGQAETGYVTVTILTPSFFVMPHHERASFGSTPSPAAAAGCGPEWDGAGALLLA